MSDQPLYIWFLVLIPAVGIPATTAMVLFSGALSAGFARGVATGVASAFAVIYAVWLAVTGYLASMLMYRGPEGGLAFGLATGGALIALLLAARIPMVSRILAAPGTDARLTVPHTLRVAGVIFLILMAQGQVSAAFALPAGLGDMAIGITAPVVATRLARARRASDAVAAAVRFNLLGLLDLVVALGLGVLLGPPWLLGGTPSTEVLRLLPSALIPTAAVPLALALHILTLGWLSPASAGMSSTSPHASRQTQVESWSGFVARYPSEEQP
jgi:hypothetical protein